MNFSKVQKLQIAPRNSLSSVSTWKDSDNFITRYNSSRAIENANLQVEKVETTAKWSHDAPYYHHEWVICETIHLLCFFTSLYILYALIHFYTVQQSHHIYSGRSSGSRWLEKMCIGAVICAIVRFINNQFLLFTWWHNRSHCSVLLNVSIALYFLSLYPVYLFLWIRQRIFYSNRALKHLYNKVTRFISWATIFCFFVLTLVSMVLFVVDRKNSASGRVCGDHYHDYEETKKLENESNQGEWFSEFFYNNMSGNHHLQGLQVNTITGLMGGVIQTSFLVLFLYPIMDSKLRAVRNLNMRCHHSLMKLIRRSFLLSGVCIFSDVGIALGVKGIHALFPEAVFAPLAMYDVNLIVNIICIVTTFRRWRKMLFPCLYNCFGRSLISSSTRKYYVEHRLSRLTNSNGEGGSRSFLGSRIDQDSPTRKEIWETKIIKAPVVDVQLVSDEEEKEKEIIKDKLGKMDQKKDKDTENDNRNSNCNYKPSIKYRANFSQKHFRCGVSKNHHRYGRRYSEGESDISRPRTFTLTTGTPIYSSSRFSLRSKKAKNVVTTKLVLKSESFLLMEPTKSNNK